MKIENFEYFVKRVARKLNTNIDVISLCKKYVWFDNGYFMALDNDGYLYFKGDNAGIIALSGMIQDYATQKDFFHALDIVIATEETETTEETEETETNRELEVFEVSQGCKLTKTDHVKCRLVKRDLTETNANYRNLIKGWDVDMSHCMEVTHKDGISTTYLIFTGPYTKPYMCRDCTDYYEIQIGNTMYRIY